MGFDDCSSYREMSFNLISRFICSCEFFLLLSLFLIAKLWLKKLSVLFLSAKITPRGGELRNDVNHIVPSQVPGLDLELSPRVLLAGSPTNAQYTQKDSYHDPAYTENRVLTPNKYRHHGHHTAEFGTQTGMKAPDLLDTDRDGVYSLLTSACCLLPTKGKTLNLILRLHFDFSNLAFIGKCTNVLIFLFLFLLFLTSVVPFFWWGYWCGG